MNVWVYSILSVIIVSLISLVGIITLLIKANRLTTLLLPLVAFSAGAMLGDVFIHLLPELIEEAGG